MVTTHFFYRFIRWYTFPCITTIDTFNWSIPIFIYLMTNMFYFGISVTKRNPMSIILVCKIIKYLRYG